MLSRIRRKFEAVRNKKHHVFGDLNPIIERCLKEYAHLFPNKSVSKHGSGVVYHFNVVGVDPISLEKEHGSRDCLPPKFAKRAINGIDDLLAFIEAHTHETDEGPELLSDAELPD